MDYYEIIPPNPKPNMALIIFLHGDGGHSNFDAMKSSAAFKAVENGSLYNGEEFIFIMPKSGPGSAGASDWLSDGIVNKLFGVIDKVSTDYKIDTNRIYLTGHSRGAIATWLLTDKYPNKFAAIMTISGDGNIHPEKFKNIPIRAFAGTYPNDNWAYQGNKANCDRVVSAGGNCTFYPYNTNHGGTPAKAYTKEHINWLLRQKRR
jgi:predicted peptidase